MRLGGQGLGGAVEAAQHVGTGGVQQVEAVYDEVAALCRDHPALGTGQRVVVRQLA